MGSSQNRDPGAWTWSPRHQWPPSPPTPSWTLWQVGRCTCLKTRTSPSPRRSCRAQCQPPASLRTGRTSSSSSPHPPPPTPTSTPRTRILNGFQVESCKEKVPAEEATHPTCGSLPPGEEGEEEGAEQDGSLQVPREEEGRAEHGGRGARTSRYQEQGAQGQADRDGDRGEIAEEVDDGGGLGQDCQR